MAFHNETGSNGEELAVSYFQKKDYCIKERNWRYNKLEVDIIASWEDTLHFIEVKTRYSTSFGFPESAVTRQKLSNLIKAANYYHLIFPSWKEIQIDILAILMKPGNIVEYHLIEDVRIY